MTAEHGREEGALCRRDGCGGRLEFSKPDNCSCHINPPCGACTSTYLHCPDCGWEADDDALAPSRPPPMPSGIQFKILNQLVGCLGKVNRKWAYTKGRRTSIDRGFIVDDGTYLTITSLGRAAHHRFKTEVQAAYRRAAG